MGSSASSWRADWPEGWQPVAIGRDRLDLTDTAAIAATVAALVTVATDLAGDAEATGGVFYFSNAGSVTWAGFAAEIFRQSTARGGPTAAISPIAIADYPTPARRPANSLLETGAIRDRFGIAPRPWQDALNDVLDDLIGAVK